MEGPVREAKTSERLFWFQPEQARGELATEIGKNRLPDQNGRSFGARVDKNLFAVQVRTRTAISAISTACGSEVDRGTVFLFLPASAGIGAIVYFNLEIEPKLSAILFGLTALIGCHMLAHAKPMVRLALLLALSLVTGMLCAKVETIRAGAPMLGSDVTTRLTGRISAMARDAKGGWRVTVDVIATERPALRFGPDRVVISARTLPQGVKVGDGLKGLVHLRPQSGPVRPGNYDFAFYNYYRGIGANGFLLGKPDMVAVPAKSGIVASALLTIANIRQQLTQHILANIKGEPGDIAASLITGQRDGISDETNSAMRLSGLSHVLSISGFHMALVAAIIIGSFRAVLALFSGFSARHPVKKLAALMALFGSAFYLLLSGADVAAQRSFIMLAVMLLAMTVDRAAISMRNLAIAACITIAISPHEILGPSFQMSYSATAALIAFYGSWSRRSEKSQSRRHTSRHLLLLLPAKAVSHIGAIAMTSLVAGTASSIFAAYHFNNTAPFGLIGNALALPVISIFVMPFAVLGLLAMPFQLDWLPFAVMGRGIEVVIMIAKMVASWSPSGSLGLMPQTTLILMSMGLLLLLFLSTRLRLIGVPLLLAAALLMVRVKEPVIIISEDAKLVAVRGADHNLAVNRSVGSQFSLDNWQQGYGIDEVIKPKKADTSPLDTQFECDEKLCTAREPGGLIIAYTDDPVKMPAACEAGDIVILAFATTNTSCGDNALVVTKRDLALNGGVEISLSELNQMPNLPENPSSQHELEAVGLDEAAIAHLKRLQTATMTYAVGSPVRPWNVYRIYSRGARNLDEYKSRRKPKSNSPQ